MQSSGAQGSRGWRLEQSYFQLPAAFYTRLKPTPAPAPELVFFNRALAAQLGLKPECFGGAAEIAAIFSGNQAPEGAEPFAQAYAGHQFGNFTKLGDGRAIVLGEQIDPQGRRWDLQFKGSGRTPYSRRGDGRAALGPMLREYVISEAMHAFGIPTSRSLAVVATGEPVYRETVLPGAVLTRVAASHIRVGTFEFAAAFQGLDGVRALADYSIERHYPELKPEGEKYAAFLREVTLRQARLIARWMLVGFIHGVMNTDNMLISGETIDYGPCAFMDRYDPATVFSSIDEGGRYAYANQPPIAKWNLARLAETLLPLLHAEESRAIEIASEILSEFDREYSRMWFEGMCAKLGILIPAEGDLGLIEGLLRLMHERRLDFTNTFVRLTRGDALSPELGDEWVRQWESRIQMQSQARPQSPGVSLEEARVLMRKSNPTVIPRNHLVEEALAAAVERGELGPFQELLSVVQNPFGANVPLSPRFQEPSPEGGDPYRTFCGT